MATAQASEDAAKNMLSNAKKNKEDIKLQAEDSKKKLAEAKKFLMEAEQRWEVVAIDIDEEEDDEGSSKKKKAKLTPSPQGNSSLTAVDGAVGRIIVEAIWGSESKSWSGV